MCLRDKIPESLFFPQILWTCISVYLIAVCRDCPTVRLHQALRIQPAALQIIKCLRLRCLPYICRSSHATGGRVIISVRHRSFICQDHLSVGLLHRRGSTVSFCDIIVDLIGSAVVHMGAVPGIARPQHMSVGIGSGTDSLCFQGFQRVGCRHLTWHYTVEIFFQRKLIYHCNSVCGPQQLYMPSVRRCSLTSIHIDQPYPAGQHCRYYTDPFSHEIIAVCVNGHLVSPGKQFFLHFLTGSVL